MISWPISTKECFAGLYSVIYYSFLVFLYVSQVSCTCILAFMSHFLYFDIFIISVLLFDIITRFLNLHMKPVSFFLRSSPVSCILTVIIYHLFPIFCHLLLVLFVICRQFLVFWASCLSHRIISGPTASGCDSYPCLNNGSCNPIPGSLYDFTCSCTTPWQGFNCAERKSNDKNAR